MTVSQVFGCGLQKGHTEVYRGKEYTVNLVPMVKVETVVCDIPVDLVMDTAVILCRPVKLEMVRFLYMTWKMLCGFEPVRAVLTR